MVDDKKTDLVLIESRNLIALERGDWNHPPTLPDEQLHRRNESGWPRPAWVAVLTVSQILGSSGVSDRLKEVFMVALRVSRVTFEQFRVVCPPCASSRSSHLFWASWKICVTFFLSYILVVLVRAFRCIR